MNRKLDIVTIKGKQFVFIDELSIGSPLGVDFVVPDIAEMSFIPNSIKEGVKKESERLLREAHQDIENMNAYFEDLREEQE